MTIYYPETFTNNTLSNVVITQCQQNGHDKILAIEAEVRGKDSWQDHPTGELYKISGSVCG